MNSPALRGSRGVWRAAAEYPTLPLQRTWQPQRIRVCIHPWKRKSSTVAKDSNGPLKGVKILDLSRVLAAPLCTQILADYGADVIKVEDLGKGDDTRHWKSSKERGAWKSEAGPVSNYFAAINRNKRSICLNLKHEKGRDALLKLVKEADVVVENFRPGTMEKLRIGYGVLKATNPKIIHATISGYGPSGPSAKRAGYDMIAGAEAGLLHLTGERNGPPVRPGLGLTDMSTGLFLHGAIVSALYAREKSGVGQKIDASLFESQIALLINVGMCWLNLGEETARWGTQHPSVVPYDAFKTKDLYFVCGATNDKQFATFCKLLGTEELVTDDRFRTNADRVVNRDALFPILNDVFKKKTTDEWLEAFEGTGMPYAPINTMERVFDHPQTAARDMVQSVEWDAAHRGSIKLIGPPVKFSETKTSIRRRPPLLGEHSAEILQEIGLSASAIQELHDLKVI